MTHGLDRGHIVSDRHLAWARLGYFPCQSEFHKITRNSLDRLGEFQHGAVRAGHDSKTVCEFLEIGIALMDPAPVIPVYASICAGLQADPVYRLIGQNDLWIASIAVAFDKPLVTRNRRHFESIPRLCLEALE
jgi:predicted nucleic acid-binding protein